MLKGSRGGETVKEKVFIRIYRDGEYITSQDVSCFTMDQVDEMIRVKAEYGLECWVERVFINKEV